MLSISRFIAILSRPSNVPVAQKKRRNFLLIFEQEKNELHTVYLEERLIEKLIGRII